MDRNREARRAAASMAAAPNGLSRRRHRSSSLRDSREEDGQVELQELGRLRDRGIKKDRERDRDRERERDRDRVRERSSRSSKRRRGERMMNAGDDSSEEEESVNDEEYDDEDVDVAGAFSRMLPPLPNPVVSAAPPPPSISPNHNQGHNHNVNSHHPQHRKSLHPSIAAKVLKAAPPAWKVADETIGFSVPRKARSASTKRSHDWVSGGGGEQMINRQASTSPVRQGIVSSTPSPAAVRDAPLSPPSSSNASVRKKIPNGGGAKPRSPPKSSTTSKSWSSNNNPEELEIEIAEVLYGLKTQSQAPCKNDSTSKLELNNKSSSDAKSRVSSPVSNSSPSAAIMPQNSSSSAAPLSAVAPKRKRPRQLPENNLGSFSARSSPKLKVEVDPTLKTETSSPNLEINSGSAAENGDLANSANSLAEANNQPQQRPPDSMKLEASVLSDLKGALTEEAGETQDVVLPTKEEVNFLKKESTAVSLDENQEDMTVMSTVTATKVNTVVSEMGSKTEEKFQIDLMAPPPQLRASPGREGEIDFVGDKKRMVFDMDKRGEMMKDKEDDKEETVVQSDDKRAKPIIDEVELQKPHINKERNIDLQFDLEKPDRESIHKAQHHHTPKSQSQSFKVTLSEESTHTDKTAQPSSLPLPMSVASWPGGLPPPMGYMAPLQGVVSMDLSAMSSSPIQPLFSQPRPKRCATHCHIARNIHYYQQLMKMNPFWPTAAGGSAPMLGAKPCNLNVIPSAELNGNIAGSSVNSGQDKGQGITIFPGHAGKDKVPQTANISDSAHRKQQIFLQQALPPVAPNNLLHGPAFIFNQQQAAVAAASSRPGSLKPPSTTSSLASTSASSSSTISASATAPAAATALSFNYPNMSANETQYLLLQNNPYPFPIPAVGAPPNFRGTHAQAMTMFNGSYYSSQIIHPSHLQQQQPPLSQPQQIRQSHQNTSNGSSSSQKHLQNQQQRPQGTAINGGTGNGNLHNFPAPKNRSSQQLPQHPNQHITPPQARQLETEVGGEDSPSTADSRVSRATMNIYGQNFAMPIHPQNFALMTSPAGMTGATAASGNSNQHDKKQQHQYQQQGFKGGVDIMPPQTFAMSFGSINGSATASGIDISSLAQNHAILQSLPEVTRQNCYQIMQAAAPSQVSQQKKDSRMTEDGKSGVGDLSNADEESKVLVGKAQNTGAGQSIAFSRPDFTDASGSTLSGNSVVDSSARTLNLSSGSARTSHSPMPNVMGTTGAPSNEPSIQLKYYAHQQKIKMQEQNEQRRQKNLLAAVAASRSKTPATSNGSAYAEHLTSSSSIAAKFPNALSGFPQNFVQNSNTSNNQTQSPQWKNSTRNPNSQVQSPLASSTSSLKNHPQQQSRTQQSHTQISFGANQKPSASQGQQPPNSSQSPSPPLVVGSPTHSSISKGASGSPRTTTASTNKNSQTSTLSSQQVKNSPSISSQKSSPAGGRNVPSILGNPHIASSLSAGTKTQQQQLQQQFSKQTLQPAQDAQLFFSNPYLQAQPPHSTSLNASAASGGYYLQRRRPEQQQQQSQQPQGSAVSCSTGILSLCPPVTASNTSTTDPAKAVVAAAAAAAAASNMKGGGLFTHGMLHAAQFTAQSSGNPHHLLPAGFSYVHGVPAAVQVKPAEQKQPAGNDNLHACWQPEKK